MSTISAGRHQSFGTISKQHSHDRNRRPGREHPIKHTGESEMRHLAAYVGAELIAEIRDRANNPVVAAEIIRAIVTAPQPMAIPEAVDRNRYPLGNDRIIALVNHSNRCDGFKYAIKKDKS